MDQWIADQVRIKLGRPLNSEQRRWVEALEVRVQLEGGRLREVLAIVLSVLKPEQGSGGRRDLP